MHQFFTFIICCSAVLNTRAQCPDEGLRDRTFSGWSQSIGLRYWGESIESIETPNPVFDTSARFVPINDTSLRDPYTLNRLRQVAPGMDYSVRIGDYIDGANGERMTTNFTVTNENALFTLHFAAVSERPDHPADRQPLFGAKLKDQNDSLIFCTDILYIPRNSNYPVKKCTISNIGSNPVYIEWLDWQVITLDLRPFLGQTLELDIANGDCGLGSHFSLGYFAIECQPARLTYRENYCLKDGQVTMVAPKGFEKYEWDNGVKTDSVTIIGAKIGDTVRCKLTSNYGCESYIEQIIEGSDIEARFTAVFDTTLLAASFANLTSVLNASLTSTSWSFGDGNSSLQFNPVHKYDTFGVFSVSLMLESDSGCMDEYSREITFYPRSYPRFRIADTCGLLVEFVNLSQAPVVGDITAYKWSFGDGTTSEEAEPMHKYAKSGRYLVRLVTEANGMVRDTFDTIFSIYPTPIASFSDDPACINNPTPFYDRSEIESGWIESRYWTFGAIASGDSLYEMVTFPSPGNVEVTLLVTSNSGCTDYVSRQVKIYPFPIDAKFSFSPEIIEVLEPNVQFKDESENPMQWKWTLNDSVFSREQHPHYLVVQDTASYVVQLEVENTIGCKDIESQILVVEPTFSIYIPSAYTPDGDGINDLFEVKGEGIQRFRMMVYDRWGNEVQTLNDINKPIIIDSENQSPSTTYYYEAIVVDKNGLSHKREGVISVLR